MKYFPFFLIFSSISLSEVQKIDVIAEPVSSLAIGNSLSSSMVITDSEIKSKNYRTVYEAIRSVPGVDVVNASPGQTATIFIRGAKSEQTLVYVDGVEYNDPTDPGRGADLGVLQMDNIERIEILRGSQSVEYGGIGNVILIYTKSGKSPTSQVYLEGGSFGSVRGEVGSRGLTASDLDYSFSASGYRTDGISASATGTERDGASSVQFTTRLRQKLDSHSHVGLTTRYFDSRSDLDLVPADTKNYTASQQNLLSRIDGQTKFGNVKPSLALSLRTIHRNSLDYGSTPNTRFLANGDIEKVESKNVISLSTHSELGIRAEFERHHVTTSGDYGTGAFGMDRAFTQTGLAVEYALLNDQGFFGTLGGRLDYHSAFYVHPIVRFAPGYRFGTDTTVRAAVGNGFKSPSLYQLYGEYGEGSLKPEKSWTADLGVEQDLLDKRLHLTLTGFYSKFTDLVDFQFATSRYINLGKVWTAGIEYSQGIRVTEVIRLTSSYTYLETRDEIAEQELARRPRHRVSNELSVQIAPVEFSFNHLFVGSRIDIDATTFGRKRVDGYHLINLYANWKAWETGTVFGRLENIFNTKYQAVDGYQSPGLAAFVGVKQNL